MDELSTLTYENGEQSFVMILIEKTLKSIPFIAPSLSFTFHPRMTFMNNEMLQR